MSTDTLSTWTDSEIQSALALLPKLDGGDLALLRLEAGLPPMGTPTPVEFRAKLTIPAGTGTANLAAIADPWQEADYRALDPGWMQAAGLASGDGKLRAYLERARGSSKTTDLAVMVLWILYAAVAKRTGVVAAAARKQAKRLRDLADGILRLNGWLSERLVIHNYEISNPSTGSVLTIESSDAETAYGATPDFVVADELTHWQSPALWHALVSSVAKRESCMMVVISNAGTGRGTSWQWETREACRNDPDWYFSRQDSLASWITESAFAEQRRQLPPREFQRLWLNEWTSGRGDALPMEDVEECCQILPGPIPCAEPGWFYFMGLDLALHRDHAALVVLGVNPATGRYRVPLVRSWKPQDYGGTIRLGDVQREAKRCAVAYDVRCLYFDPHEAGLMTEQLREFGLDCEGVTFSDPHNLNLMAERLILTFRDRLIDLYHDDDLVSDLGRIEIVQRPTLGFKIQSVSDERGHCDRAIALAIVLARAWDLMRELRADMESPRGPERVRA